MRRSVSPQQITTQIRSQPSTARSKFRALMVVQCDQTSFLAISMMLLSEEARRPLQRPVQLPLTSEVQHGNRIDCARSAVLARWRRVGILSLARLGRSHEERVTMLLDGSHAIHEESLLWRQVRELSFRFF